MTVVWYTRWEGESLILHFYRFKGSLTSYTWMIWDELAFDDAVSDTQREMDCSTAKCYIAVTRIITLFPASLNPYSNQLSHLPTTAPTCDGVHSLWLYSIAPLGNYAIDTIMQYPTQSHYPDTVQWVPTCDKLVPVLMLLWHKTTKQKQKLPAMLVMWLHFELLHGLIEKWMWQ